MIFPQLAARAWRLAETDGELGEPTVIIAERGTKVAIRSSSHEYVAACTLPPAPYARWSRERGRLLLQYSTMSNIAIPV
jgi:hypothetical protein